MSAVETAPEQETEVQPEAPVAEAEKTRHDIFQWCQWVHVGSGASECPFAVAVEDPEYDRTQRVALCEDPDHFHAWVRLPNPFQVRDITEKAQAARARRLRMLRDAESDAHVILEDELAQLKDSDKGLLVDELLDRDWTEFYTKATTEVMDTDDPDYIPEGDEDIPKLYEGIIQDREEYARQKDLPEEKRGDDFAELEKTLAAYGSAVEAEMKRLQTPRREQLNNMDMDELIEIVRRDRIDVNAGEAYLHTFNAWQWFVCTYKPRPVGIPNERYFSSFNEMRFETPTEVVMELRAAFEGLEKRLGESRQAGNS